MKYVKSNDWLYYCHSRDFFAIFSTHAHTNILFPVHNIVFYFIFCHQYENINFSKVVSTFMFYFYPFGVVLNGFNGVKKNYYQSMLRRKI